MQVKEKTHFSKTQGKRDGIQQMMRINVPESLKQSEKDINSDPDMAPNNDPLPTLMKENWQDLREKNSFITLHF